MIRRPPRATRVRASAASEVYKRQVSTQSTWGSEFTSTSPSTNNPEAPHKVCRIVRQVHLTMGLDMFVRISWNFLQVIGQSLTSTPRR
eukprot:NODE_4972_length_300_cov_46.318725_g4527_i0.p1 GENE.NODE_4972_length_300_cov_46.318725_g4527_i0~~NODE_4972_length_300_cov_46.318725_g4527_i0.p1  ORF type:complete len:88 (+),score=15.30 NODE_4972_length_300_cov_46.318725_g4527_i0:2-265(+)